MIYCTAGYPYLDIPSRNLKIVMRLPENSAEAKYYDICNARTRGGDYYGRCLTAYALEGSADGRIWEKVAEDDEAVIPASASGWYSGDSTHKTLEVKRTMLAFTNVASVAVAPGAKLVANGPVAPIKKLVLDANGAGTIEGFDFAEEGVLEVTSMSNKMHAAIAIDLSGAESAANIGNWTLLSGGKVRDWNVQVGDGVIHVTKPGLVILVD